MRKHYQNVIPKGKTPGNDGLPIEFSNVFWSSIGEMVVESFNEGYEKGGMSNSQRQDVITFIEKRGKDRTCLKIGDRFLSLMLTLK